MPEDTRLNFIIAAGIASRLTNEICVVTSRRLVTGYRLFEGIYKHMFRAKANSTLKAGAVSFVYQFTAI
jgi:hypothetical protein